MIKKFSVCLEAAPEVVSGGYRFLTTNSTIWTTGSARCTLLIPDSPGKMLINSQTFSFPENAVLLCPPSRRIYLEFKEPAESGHFHSSFIPDLISDPLVDIPIVSVLSPEVRQFWRTQFAAMLDWSIISLKPRTALTWNLLWSVAKDPSYSAKSIHLEFAERFIGENLANKLPTNFISEHVNVSPRQLDRIFLAEHDLTVSEYVRHHRVCVAIEKLTLTTEAIKTIASQVGIPELSHFNKLIKSITGHSPTVIREERKNPGFHMALAKASEKK